MEESIKNNNFRYLSNNRYCIANMLKVTTIAVVTELQ